MNGTRVLLFDLGGVIVDFRGGEGLHALVGDRHSLEFCADRWWRLPELDLLERGALAPDLFADAFIREWRLDIDRAAFIGEFRGWVRGVYDGVPALLDALRPKARLACLSNVNPVHWDRCVELGVDRLFERRFLSHEMRLRKPEGEIYRAVADALGAAPREIFFFDDVAANVEAARAADMRAALVENNDVRAALSAVGFA